MKWMSIRWQLERNKEMPPCEVMCGESPKSRLLKMAFARVQSSVGSLGV